MRLKHLTRSLAARLTFVSAIGNAVALLVMVSGLTAFQLYQAAKSESHSWDYLGAPPARDLVVKSLTRTESGLVEIRPVPSLAQLVNEMPNLRYAVFDRATGEAIPGSSPELIIPLVFPNGMRVTDIYFYTNAKMPGTTFEGRAETVDTPIGRYVVAIYGFNYKFQDIFWDIYQDFLHVIPQETPIIVIIIGSIWFAVRKSMVPLRRVAHQAQAIDLHSINQRLPENEVPSEIEPFVSAVNNVLAKLDAGIERERRFSANAAHELRTPISILIAFVETMPNDAISSELRRHVSQLQSIVEQLLASARIAQSPVHGDEIVDLAAVVFAKVSDYTPLIMECGRDIVFEGPSSDVMAKGNIRAIESVVGNLLDNALRAEPPGGTVLVAVNHDATISIVDHGSGIAAEDREKIFEPFWRKCEQAAGTGLGLAIAKELIDKLAGSIWVEGTPGGGATFRLSFRKVEAT